MDISEMTEIYSFVTHLLNLYSDHLNLCDDENDYYNLFIGILMFSQLARQQFKEDFNKSDEENFEDLMLYLETTAKDLTNSFINNNHTTILN